MEILTALGVNATVGIQFVIFLITYLVIYFVLIKPYFEAFLVREEKTVGQTEDAERLISEAQQLQAEYEKKAREISQSYKVIYDQNRLEATKEYDRLVADARLQAKKISEEAALRIGSEMSQAQSKLSQEIPQISKEIMVKLIGKEIGA